MKPLIRQSNPEYQVLTRKEYRFLGIRVPIIRKCVVEYRAIPLEDTRELLKSPFHEARLLALLILEAKYSATNVSSEKETIYKFYLTHTKFINNWDLVDCSAEYIVVDKG